MSILSEEEKRALIDAAQTTSPAPISLPSARPIDLTAREGTRPGSFEPIHIVLAECVQRCMMKIGKGRSLDGILRCTGGELLSARLAPPAPPGYMAVIAMGGDVGVMGGDIACMRAIVQRALNQSQVTPSEDEKTDAPLSPIEVRIASRWLQELVAEIARDLSLPMALQLKELTTVAPRLTLSLSDAPVWRVRFEGDEPTAGQLMIALPVSILRAVLPQTPRAPVKRPHFIDPNILPVVFQVPIDVVAQLGTCAISLDAWLSAEPGSVLLLRSRPTDPVPLFFCGVEKMSGKPRVEGEKLVVDVTRLRESD